MTKGVITIQCDKNRKSLACGFYLCWIIDFLKGDIIDFCVDKSRTIIHFLGQIMLHYGFFIFR